MFHFIQYSFGAYRESGARIRPLYFLLCGLNLIITIGIGLYVQAHSALLVSPDWADVFFEGATVALYFCFFCLAAALYIKRAIKHNLLTGIFLAQQGFLLDCLDEFFVAGWRYWQVYGDALFLAGSVFTAYGIARWVVHTYDLSVLDSLTRVYNRRHFIRTVNNLLARQLPGTEHVLVAVDLDDFKQLNDEYGHAAGDEALRFTARQMRNVFRQTDIVCRTGGEEFEIVMARSNVDAAISAVTRLMEVMQSQRPTELPMLTLSAGIAKHVHNDTMDDWKKRADNAMYQAKAEGKNRFVVA